MLEFVASERERARCRERLERLSESTLDCESIQREAIADLRRVIGFDRWCWPFADSETLLPLSGLAEHDFGPGVPRMLELEYSDDHFAAKHVLARRANPAASLGTETGGDLALSGRWYEVMRPAGIGAIAAVACRDALGCWGWIEAYRDGADRRFEAGDLELLASVGPSLGSALRRGLMAASKGDALGPSPPGVIVLNPDLTLVSSTAGARARIDVLPAAALFAGWAMLPAQVYPVATRSRSRNAVTGAHALERAVDGRWVMIEAALLEGDGDGQIAVTLRSSNRDVRPPLPRLCIHTTRARRRRRGRRRTRHARPHRATLHLSPHGPGSSEVDLPEDRHPQPPPAAREVQRFRRRALVAATWGYGSGRTSTKR
jgi:hypothetical protein